MIKILSSLLLFIFATNAYSCEIQLWDKVYFASTAKVNNWRDLIVKSDCDQESELKVIRFVTDGKGTLSTSVIAHELGLTNIIISPTKVQVVALTQYLQSQGRLPETFSANNLTFTDGNQYLPLGSFDNLRIECDQCDRLGEATFKLQIERSGSLEGKWARANIVQKVLAYFPKKHFGINQKFLRSDDFETRYVSTNKPEELFRCIDQIEYFSTVRPLNPEKPLKQNDLFSMNLVTPQSIAEVILSSGKMSLSTKGYPVKNGRYGESINVRNANSNRLITAKVIGRNKVVVE